MSIFGSPVWSNLHVSTVVYSYSLCALICLEQHDFGLFVSMGLLFSGSPVYAAYTGEPENNVRVEICLQVYATKIKIINVASNPLLIVVLSHSRRSSSSDSNGSATTNRSARRSSDRVPRSRSHCRRSACWPGWEARVRSVSAVSRWRWPHGTWPDYRQQSDPPTPTASLFHSHRDTAVYLHADPIPTDAELTYNLLYENKEYSFLRINVVHEIFSRGRLIKRKYNWTICKNCKRFQDLYANSTHCIILMPSLGLYSWPISRLTRLIDYPISNC